MLPYKSTRLCLEKKAEEFKKVAEYSHQHKDEYFNSAISRYYYSMYIRISQICKTFDENNSCDGGFESHRKLIRNFIRNVSSLINSKEHSTLENKKLINKLLARLEECCKYRNKADYKDVILECRNVNFLKKTLEMFDEVYMTLLEISNIEEKERNDVDGITNKNDSR